MTSRQAPYKAVMYFRNVLEPFTWYWEAYGGLSALVRSWYLHLAAVLTVLMFSTWTSDGWWDEPLHILPNIIGFSIGSFAVLAGIGSQTFRELLHGPSKRTKTSPLLEAGATFVHFLLVQVAGVVCALVAKSWQYTPTGENWIGRLIIGSPILSFTASVITYIGSFFSYLLFMYSLLLAIAAVMAIFKLVRLYDNYVERGRLKSRSNNQPPTQPAQPVESAPAPTAPPP